MTTRTVGSTPAQSPQFEFDEFAGSNDQVKAHFNARYKEITEAGGTVLLSSLVIQPHEHVPSARVCTFTYTMDQLPGTGTAAGTDGIDQPKDALIDTK